MTTVTAPVRAPSGAPAPESASPMRYLLSDALVFAGRNLAHIKELPERLIDVTIQPLMFVLLFAYVFGGAIAIQGGSYHEYLIGGILVQTLAFGMMRPAMSIATDLGEGVIDRFLALPTARMSYLLGHLIAELAGVALSMVILSVSGLIVGWRTHTGVLDVVEAYALLTLFATGMIWLGTLIGLLVRSPDAVTGVAFLFVFPLTFVSNAFVPIDSMPKVLKWIAEYNPLSVMVAAVRHLWGNPVAPTSSHVWPLEHAVLASLIWIIAMFAVFVPLTVLRFKQRTTS
jgi:ABC-2 type transport system permease protein